MQAHWVFDLQNDLRCNMSLTVVVEGGGVAAAAAAVVAVVVKNKNGGGWRCWGPNRLMNLISSNSTTVRSSSS